MYYNTLMAEYEYAEKMRQTREKRQQEQFPLPTTSKTNWVALALNQIRLFLF